MKCLILKKILVHQKIENYLNVTKVFAQKVNEFSLMCVIFFTDPFF